MIRTTKITQAVILAAGVGRRLAGVHTKPKGWLQLGEKAIIEESIETLRRFAVGDIVIVTGHEAHLYEALCDEHDGIRTLYNPDYATTGPLCSWYRASELIADEFLLLESDIIYEPRAIDVMLNEAEPDTILLSGPTGQGDEVFVSCIDGVVQHMSQDKDALQEITGELVGISRFSARFYECMMELIPPGRACTENISYEQGILAASAKCPVRGLLVPNLAWCEIDDESQYGIATESVYPRIRKQRAAWTS